MDLQQINIYPFSSASKQETLLMEIDNHFFEISKDTAELIEYLKNNGNDEESINRYDLHICYSNNSILHYNCSPSAPKVIVTTENHRFLRSCSITKQQSLSNGKYFNNQRLI